MVSRNQVAIRQSRLRGPGIRPLDLALTTRSTPESAGPLRPEIQERLRIEVMHAFEGIIRICHHQVGEEEDDRNQ